MKTGLLPFLAAVLAFPVSALDYERDIMPIFVQKCGDCHSSEGKAKGGLKLDDPEHFHQRFEKNSVVVPGDWDASYLFVTLFRPADHDDAMPPEGKGERLTPEETVMVQQWIADGAPIAGERGEKGPMPKEGEPGWIATETGEKTMDEGPQPREWTNREGKKIIATLLKVDGDIAVLKLESGRVFDVPIGTLSDESQEALQN